MSYRFFQIVSVLLPTVLIGGFEYIRHDFLLPYMSMETGNFYITILTFVLSFLFAIWMFKTIRSMNEKLVEAQAKRAVYEERDRLARELHDGIAQSLFFLNVKLKQGKIDDALSAVSSIDHDVRQAIFNLRALPDEGSSLPIRLEKWVTQWSVHTGIDVTQEYDLADDILSPAEQVQLFGLIQESFANIRKHANAQHATIFLRSTSQGKWELVITDDGCGITEQPTGRPKYGLTMMKERASQLKARIEISRMDTGGTKIHVTR